MIFDVENFKYNGFFVQSKPGKAKYKAEFEYWTTDPGIALCKCSDGKDRLIPSCCLIGDTSILPKQNLSKKILFGNRSES